MYYFQVKEYQSKTQIRLFFRLLHHLKLNKQNHKHSHLAVVVLVECEQVLLCVGVVFGVHRQQAAGTEAAPRLARPSLHVM